MDSPPTLATSCPSQRNIDNFFKEIRQQEKILPEPLINGLRHPEKRTHERVPYPHF
mgnify:CR=1 FL=1